MLSTAGRGWSRILAPRREGFFPTGGGPRLVSSLILLPFLIGALPCAGQDVRTVGVHFGQVRARQLWDGPLGSRTSTGVSAGINVDVPTPIPHFSVRVELSYVQRGSVVWDEVLDPDALVPADARSHYLSIPVYGRLRLGIPGGEVFVLLGPTVDQLLETECSADLCRLLLEESPTVLGFSLGSGLSLRLPRGSFGDLEARVNEGLTQAYRSGPSGVRYRSVEFLLRIRIPS